MFDFTEIFCAIDDFGYFHGVVTGKGEATSVGRLPGNPLGRVEPHGAFGGIASVPNDPVHPFGHIGFELIGFFLKYSVLFEA